MNFSVQGFLWFFPCGPAVHRDSSLWKERAEGGFGIFCQSSLTNMTRNP